MVAGGGRRVFIFTEKNSTEIHQFRPIFSLNVDGIIFSVLATWWTDFMTAK